MTDRIDELGERARWFLEQFDEIDLADICAAEETAKLEAQAAIDRVRQLCELTIAASVRVQAIDQARDTLAALDREADTPVNNQPDTLRRLRAWLAAEYDKADAADRAADVPPELMIRPHNGIAAGIAIALHGVDCMLGTQPEEQPTRPATPCPACSRADQAGLSAAELHAGCSGAAAPGNET